MINKQENERFERTLKFIKKNVGVNVSILDLGTKNLLSDHLISEGFNVTNTNDENLDDEYLRYTDVDVELITAFEIFEHMLAPYNFLKNVKKGKLIASVPLNGGREYPEFHTQLRMDVLTY